MESVFANDTTNDLLEMIRSTKKQKDGLQEEIDSCQDCIDDLSDELLKRGYTF